MPPLLADFSHARACKPFCEKYLTLPQTLAMEGLGKKYSPGYEKEAREAIRQSAGHFLVLKMEIEHLTGKKAK